MSPYRNFLDEARQKLAEARSTLSARASLLGALRPLLPRALRRDLTRLERAIERPLRNPRDVELAERSLAEYEEQLEVAIAFSDHVIRDRAARWRRQRTWLRWIMAGGLSTAACLTALVVTGPLFFLRAQWDENVPIVCALGANNPGQTSLTSDHRAAANPCGLSVECARHGRCTTVPDGCAAQSDEDCRSSWDCQIDGQCQLVAGRCTAETDLDCAGSRQCEIEGRCKASGGECLSVDDFAAPPAAEPTLAQDARPPE